MIIVEFELEHPVLKEALSQVPEMEITWERSDAIDDRRVRILVWAAGGNFEAFESAVEEDPTVATPSRVIEVRDRRLYQTELVGEGLRTSIYPLMVEEGGVIQNLTASQEGWRFRAAFPDRASFDRLHEYCRDHEIAFDFIRLLKHLSGRSTGAISRSPGNVHSQSSQRLSAFQKRRPRSGFVARSRRLLYRPFIPARQNSGSASDDYRSSRGARERSSAPWSNTALCGSHIS